MRACHENGADGVGVIGYSKQALAFKLDAYLRNLTKAADKLRSANSKFPFKVGDAVLIFTPDYYAAKAIVVHGYGLFDVKDKGKTYGYLVSSKDITDAPFFFMPPHQLVRDD